MEKETGLKFEISEHKNRTCTKLPKEYGEHSLYYIKIITSNNIYLGKITVDINKDGKLNIPKLSEDIKDTAPPALSNYFCNSFRKW